MKQYKFLIFLFAITISSCGQSQNQSNNMKENEEYDIFEHTRVIYDYSEKDIITVNDTLIQSLPEQVKTIISLYVLSLPNYMLDEEQWIKLRKFFSNFTSLSEKDIITVNDTVIQSLPEKKKTIISIYFLSLPDYMLDEEQRIKLRKFFTNFTSLEEAKQSLFKKLGGNFEPFEKQPVYLTLKRTGNVLVFKYGFIYGMDYVLDEFKIGITGKISFVKRSEIKDMRGY